MFQQVSNTHYLSKSLLVLMLLIGGVTSVGCTTCGGLIRGIGCSDIDNGSVPEPVGSKTMEWQVAQASLALQDQTTFYKSDFIGSSTRFAPAAIDKINRAIASGIENRLWLVEPSGDAQTDKTRLELVIEILEVNGVESPTVYLAIPRAIGLPGPFAEAAISGAGLSRTGMGNAGLGNAGASQQIRQTQGLGL